MSSAPRKPLHTGESVSLYAAALIFALCGFALLMICAPAAIPLSICAAAMALWAYFRSPTLVVTSESVTFSQPRCGICTVIPWNRFRCMYELTGVSRTVLVFCPSARMKDDLRTIIEAYEQHHGSFPEVDGCLVLHPGRGAASLLPYIPETIRRMPASDGISL